jgi:HAD superfamily hydrolase (TIGR01490 family)
MRRRIIPLRLLLVIPWYSLAYKLGFFRMRRYEDGFPYLRGIGRGALEAIARESFETRLRADLYDGGVAAISQARAAGRRVVLATSSLDFIVAPLAAHLGVDAVLATALEFVEGVCTGRFDGMPMFRGEKMDRVLRYLVKEGVDARDCSFWSDSMYDLPLLEAVGRPVAVNPDFRLRRVARRRAWEIIDLS